MAEENTVQNNKTIAKNTLFLYLRMLLSVIVSLYTSRVVLQTLGVEDYGIYGVVGGVVSMFSFLNASMSGATSRFLTFEMGTGNTQKLKDTFSSAMIIHVLIALSIIVLAETIGLWFLCHKLIIPRERMFAAHMVYQLSIISMFFNVTQVPYNATIIAHEKMDVYAYVELLNVFLKLAIVFLLVIGNFDKLILYAILTLAVSIIIAAIYRIYCVKHYSESKFHFVWDKSILKPMLSFSGWDLYGNSSVVFYNQGIAMLLNMFFGPALNAANNITLTVQGTIKSFAYNVIQAFRPQIIKRYAQGELEAVNSYCVMATQYTLILFSFIAVPVYFNADLILRLWLGIVPDHTVVFLQIVLVGTMFNLANNIINIPIHASGRMKLFSLVTGTCFLAALPLMYVLLKLGVSANLSYAVTALSHLGCLVASLLLLKRNVPAISLRMIVFNGYAKYILALLPSIVLCVLLYMYLQSKWTYFLTMLLSNTLILTLGLLFIIMNMEDRKKLYALTAIKLLKIRRLANDR